MHPERECLSLNGGVLGTIYPWIPRVHYVCKWNNQEYELHAYLDKTRWRSFITRK
jgi:TM2 domain-containing membrane protein YozV